MTVSYDDADVLYIAFRKPSAEDEAVYVEKPSGDILRVDPDSGQILGVTIQLFQYRLKSGERIYIPEIGTIPFNAIMGALLEKRTPHVTQKGRR